MTRSQKMILALAGLSLMVSLAFGAWQIYKSQLWRGPDAQFGDQHLKTTVALVELHRIRYGRYPASLAELKFLGSWDPIATGSMAYHVNEAANRYCVEVQRGWIGKPKLQMPSEFWQGTGYDPALCR